MDKTGTYAASLLLTWEEAEALVGVLRRVTGAHAGPRGETDAVLGRLMAQEIGCPYAEQIKGTVHIPCLCPTCKQTLNS